MCGLDHVCSMDVVVVGHVSMVMILQSHHEGNESVRWNLKGLQQLTFLQWHIRHWVSQGLDQLFIKMCLLGHCFIHLLYCSFIYYTRCLRLYSSSTILCLRKYRMLGCVTWKMVYMVTVSGRFPEYSETLKMSIPHLFTSSNSCQWTISTHIHHYQILYKGEYIKNCAE